MVVKQFKNDLNATARGSVERVSTIIENIIGYVTGFISLVKPW